MTILRSITHWTGGPGRATAEDKAAYHRITEFDGLVVMGNQSLEDNVVTADGDYAAHTLRLNTGSYGPALAGMHGATEDPYDPGPYPIQEAQFEVHCKHLAEFHLEHGLIPITERNCLTHAEVEGVYGVKQRGKWDFTRLPFKPELIGARAVGDYMRSRVRHYLGEQPVTAATELNRPTLRKGDRGLFVRDLQTQLQQTGYFAGAIDGAFGPRTEAAVLAFQAANGLSTDGIVGEMTWRALSKPAPVALPMREVTVQDLREDGSRTIASADIAEKENTKAKRSWAVTAWAGGLGYAYENLGDLEVKLGQANGLFGKISMILIENWLVFLIVGLAMFALNSQRIVEHAQKSIRAWRTDDAQQGKNLFR